jgi:uncharacterized protein (DUF305 family)
MILPHPSLRALALALLGLAVGAGSASTQAAGATQRTDSTARLEALYHARADSALQNHTAADVAFMSGMIHHHAQALEMAGWAPSHGASPQIRTLCARIINAQQDEIARMQDWLTQRKLPVPEVMKMGGQVMVMGGDDMGAMPGMLTSDQMSQLDAARGADFDRLFLRLMIQHHRGAVAMVEQLFATEGAAQDPFVFKLANDVHVDQLTEIARMERMLATLP